MSVEQSTSSRSHTTPARAYTPIKKYHVERHMLDRLERPELPKAEWVCEVDAEHYATEEYPVPTRASLKRTSNARKIQKYGFSDDYRIQHGDYTDACDGDHGDERYMVCELCICSSLHWVKEKRPELTVDMFLPLCKACCEHERRPFGTAGIPCHCVTDAIEQPGNWLCVPCRIAAMQARRNAFDTEIERRRQLGTYTSHDGTVAENCRCGGQLDGGDLSQCHACGGIKERIECEL